MPLRFDEPSLLGEWKGDPTAIHQALAAMHSTSENAKQRAHEKNMVETKKPSFKISDSGTPFSKDADEMAARVRTMQEPSLSDEHKEYLNQQNIAQSVKSKAQETQLNALRTNALEVAKQFGTASDMTQFNELENEARTKNNTSTRDSTLDKHADLQLKPEKWVNAEQLVNNYSAKLEEFPIKDESSIENGSRTDANNFTIHTKYPVQGDPILLSNGTQKVENGVPLFKSRAPQNASELLPYVDNFLKSNKYNAQIVNAKAYSENKDLVDNNTNNWVKSMENNGGKPTNSQIQSYSDGQISKIAQESVAKQLFDNYKARIDGSTKVSYQQPTEADKDREFAKSWGSNGSYSTTYTSAENSGKRNVVFLANGKATEGSVKTYGELGISRKDKNGEPKPVIIRSDKGAWNASRGEYISQGLEMNAGGLVIMAIDKKTGVPKPTNKTAQQLQKEGSKFELFVEGKMLLGKENKAIKKEDVPDYEKYVALNNKPYLSTDNNGVNEQEEFNKLEAKFAKQGQSSYVMKRLDNNITNQLSGNDVNGFLNKNSENKKIKLELDKLNSAKGVSVPTNTNSTVQTKKAAQQNKGISVPENKVKFKGVPNGGF